MKDALRGLGAGLLAPVIFAGGAYAVWWLLLGVLAGETLSCLLVALLGGWGCCRACEAIAGGIEGWTEGLLRRPRSPLVAPEPPDLPRIGGR